jgi:hypothetical protein
MVSRALLQTVLKKLNELEPRMRLGGHNMGRAPLLLDDVMKAIKTTTVEHVEKCETPPDWSTKVGGEASIHLSETSSIFSTNITPTGICLQACQRSVSRTLRREALLHDELVEALHGDVAFVEAHSDLSPLEIALAPEIRKII